jgi:hypothetical protein
MTATDICPSTGKPAGGDRGPARDRLRHTVRGSLRPAFPAGRDDRLPAIDGAPALTDREVRHG